MQLSVDLIALSWCMRACWVIESSTRKIMIDEQQEGLTSHFTHWLLRQDGGRRKSGEEQGNIRENPTVWRQNRADMRSLFLMQFDLLCYWRCYTWPIRSPSALFFYCGEMVIRWRYQPNNKTIVFGVTFTAAKCQHFNDVIPVMETKWWPSLPEEEDCNKKWEWVFAHLYILNVSCWCIWGQTSRL